MTKDGYPHDQPFHKIVVYIVVIQITKVVDMKNQLINFKGSIINQVLNF
jgi:hypothetical protein